MAIGNMIKSWENIMRDDDGVSGTVQVLSQLVWMLFLKVYDVKEDYWALYEDNFKSAIPENCRWRNWVRAKRQNDKMTGDEMVNFVNEVLFPTLKNLTVTADSSKRLTIVRDMMAESFNYMKDGHCIRDAVDLLDGLNIEDQNELHEFNLIYETLLRGLQSAGRSGEFYTPRAMTQLMTDHVNPKLGETIADFACGTGGFLVDAVEHLRKQCSKAEDTETIEKTVFGVEKKQLPYMLCTTNMLLHNVDYPRITHGNSLTKNVREYDEKDKVDVVLMNPPYGGHEQDYIQSNFPSLLRNSETAFLFMIEIMYRLRDNGRCGVILPDSFLQNDDQSLIRIKEKLFSEFNVHTIIRMPGSCFAPYTSIATNMVFFDKTGPTKYTWIYRFDLINGVKFSMKKNPITRDKIAAIDEWWDNRVEEKDEDGHWKSKKISIDDILSENYYLDYCGYPKKERIILSPEETLSEYMLEREQLEKRLSESTQALKDSLEGNPATLFPFGAIATRLSIINSDFPQKMHDAILQAALQGKLTEQLESDGDARDLIVKIQIEKQQLLGEKKSQIIDINYPQEDEKPYDIPDNWCWTRIGQLILRDVGGGTPSKSVSEYWNGNIPWMSVKDFSQAQNGVIVDTIDHISTAGVENSATNIISPDAIIVCMRMGLGKYAKLGRPIAINQDLRAIWLSKNIDENYFLHFYSSMVIEGTGTTVKGIKRDELLNYPIPLPPLAEQHRIVKRLLELLHLCK